MKNFFAVITLLTLAIFCVFQSNVSAQQQKEKKIYSMEEIMDILSTSFANCNDQIKLIIEEVEFMKELAQFEPKTRDVTQLAVTEYGKLQSLFENQLVSISRTKAQIVEAGDLQKANELLRALIGKLIESTNQIIKKSKEVHINIKRSLMSLEPKIEV